ncbi:hypothetical protein ACFOWX_01420 [Sphingorhabdus arenilitoris]|uniref:Uncharacterized protein n=1 Tax=Sphingorhabdus arenilitoris TaxID=1490041 RepID=A0ABV8RDQ2_9SPHN
MASHDKKLQRMVEKFSKFSHEDQNLILSELDEKQQGQLTEMIKMQAAGTATERHYSEDNKTTGHDPDFVETGNLSGWIVERLNGERNGESSQSKKFKLTDHARRELRQLVAKSIPQPAVTTHSLSSKIFGWMRRVKS